MKEEVLKKAVELSKQREDLLKQFRMMFDISDPNFQPCSVKETNDGIFLKSKSGEEIKIYLKVRIRFNNKAEIVIDDTSAGIKWIENEIEKLYKINKEIEQL